MPKQLSSKDRKLYRRMIRSFEEGSALGILSRKDLFKLKAQAEWSAQSPADWAKLKALYIAPSSGFKLFGKKSVSDEQRKLGRASYLKVLAQCNEAVGVSWDFDSARVWKKSVLNPASYRTGGVLAGIDTLALFRKEFPVITLRARQGDKVQRGDLGAVTSFTWGKQKWAFKPEDDKCLAKFGRDTGIPATDARMHDRSVAFYLLARLLGLERLVVETRHAFLQTGTGLQYGILMRYAVGKQPMVMQQRPDLVRRHLKAKYLHDKEGFEGLTRMPHVLGSLTEAVLCDQAFLEDFFSASWLDYIGAQMDRHLSNLYLDIASGSGKYQGLQLIDNDMGFGTMTDPKALEKVMNGKNKGIPHHAPAALSKRLTQITGALPLKGRALWRQVNTGKKSTTSHDKPKKGAPPAELTEIARLLREEEFDALVTRLRTAAKAMAKCNPIDANTGKTLKKSFGDAKKKNKLTPFSNTSYWHELFWMCELPEQFHKIRDKPRAMSHEEFTRRIKQKKSDKRSPLLSHALVLSSKQQGMLDHTLGHPTVAFLEDFFKAHQGKALNHSGRTVKVKQLERSGAETGALFKLSVGGDQYLVKIPGQPIDLGSGPFLVAKSGMSPPLVGDPEVEHYAQIASKGRLWQTRTIETPDGTKLELALPVMTCTYTAEALASKARGNYVPDPKRMDVKHQLIVLPLAKGVRVTELLEERPGQAAKLLNKLGSAIGAFHKLYAVREVLDTGGHRTYVHGDFYGSNIFYDEHEELVTLIDLPPLAFNFISPKTCCGKVDGHDMLHDLLRLFAMTFAGKLWTTPYKKHREAICKGYCASFPKIKPDELEKALLKQKKNTKLSQALG
jgi:hypothetical protein